MVQSLLWSDILALTIDVTQHPLILSTSLMPATLMIPLGPPAMVVISIPLPPHLRMIGPS